MDTQMDTCSVRINEWPSWGANEPNLDEMQLGDLRDTR